MVFETVLVSDLQKMVNVKQLSGNLFSADNGGNKITVEILDGGAPATVTGAVYGYAIREDGKTVIMEGSLSGNKASIILPASAYAVIGKISIVVKVGTATVGACQAYVYRTTTDAIVDPGSIVPDISELLAQIGACEQATEAATEAATAAGYVNIASNKSNKVITIVTTNRNNQSTSTTITEPTMTVSESGGVVTVTCTDADGTTTVSFDTTDIDDEAGYGDTTKVWSADKLTKEFDGVHEDMLAGSAMQILSDKVTENIAPYVFRKTPVKSRRVREKKIVGGTLAWNQHAPAVNSANYDTSNASKSFSDGVVTITASQQNGSIYQTANPYTVPENHVVLWSLKVKLTTGTTSVMARLQKNGGGSFVPKYTESNTNWQTIYAFNKWNEEYANTYLSLYDQRTSGWDAIKVKEPQIFDLTAKFGFTIADYLYTLESGTDGAGIAKLKEWGFDIDKYHAYDPGSMQSVKVKEKRTVGFNQWDEQWESGAIQTSNGQNATNDSKIRAKNYIPCFPSTNYYFFNTSVDTAVFYYADDMTYIGYYSSGTTAMFTTPAKARYFRFSVLQTSYNNNICINISDPAKNGTYEPYVEHVYPMGSDELRGLFKLDANNNLYADGDVKTADGQIQRKYGYVDLGTLNFTKEDNGKFVVSDFTSAKAPANNNTKANLVCAKYTTDTNENTYNKTNDKTISLSASNTLRVYDSAYTDSATFITAMDGVYLVYELATPTTESSTPFQELQICDGDGTEEFVDAGVTASTPIRDVSIPAGHESEYYKDLVSALEGIPDAPESNGTYVLKVTVASGVPTYSWVSE